LAKKNKRIIDKSTRTVERERNKMANAEKGLLNEIKKLASQNKHVKSILYYGM
jgi:hypothetical protein